MTVKVKDILDSLNIEAPFNLAESWDNVGLIIGNPGQEVTAILTGLDPTNSLVDEAIAQGANTIITHHPVIFKPLTAINTAEPDGRLLTKALSNQIAIIACHTNFDIAPDGVSDYLALQLGLLNLTPLLTSPNNDRGDTGLGRIGNYSTPMTSEEFLSGVLEALDLPCVQIAGVLPDKISTVAVCGGSGSDLATAALRSGADVYLSAEIKHSTAVWTAENKFCVIDGTHYATEKPAVALLAQKLRKSCDEKDWKIKILETKVEQPPFTLVNKNKQILKKHIP